MVLPHSPSQGSESPLPGQTLPGSTARAVEQVTSPFWWTPCQWDSGPDDCLHGCEASSATRLERLWG